MTYLDITPSRRPYAGRFPVPIKGIILLAVLALSCPWVLSGKESAGHDQVLQDFRHGSARDWRVANGEARIRESRDPSGARESVREVAYRTRGWQIIELKFDDMGADWRGADVFEFDMYVDTDETLEKLGFRLHGRNLKTGERMGLSHHVFQRELRPGEWLRVRIPIRRNQGANELWGDWDREKLEMLQIRLWPARPNDYPEKDVRLYLDNFRLISMAPSRLEVMRRGLSELTEGNFLRGDELYRARDLQARVGRLSAPDRSDRAAWEGFTEEVLAALDLYHPLAHAGAQSSLRSRSLGETVSLVQQLGLPSLDAKVPVWQPLKDGLKKGDSALEKRSEALAYTLAMAEGNLRRMRQQIERERLFPESDFALGIPLWPQAWRSGDYTGPIRRELDLFAARREFEPFQLVILADRMALKDVTLEVSDLVNVKGAVIESSQIEVAPMGWRKLNGEPGWIADMLRSDVMSFDVKSGGFQPVWFIVNVPPDAEPGEYRGKITIKARDVKPVEVVVRLKVWPFTLPFSASLPTATHCLPAASNLDFARAIIERRWNPFQMYLWGSGADPEHLQQLTDMGASLHNLLRISRFASTYGVDSDGKPVVTNKDIFFNRLDPIVEKIRTQYPDLWPHVLLYGFDEPNLRQALAMDELYGDLKLRYDGITTMFADLYGLWHHFIPENVDIWSVSRGTLNANARDMIKEAGMQVWWWNAYNNPEDPVGLRIQFWSTLKDDLDGLLFYAMDAGGGGTRGHYKPWPSTLWPDEDRVDGGVLRMGPNGHAVPTVAFEYWREGMEDVDYLFLLREQRDMLVDWAGDNPTSKQRNLIRDANHWLSIPGHLTTGLFGGRAVDVDEIVIQMSGHTRSMEDILAARIAIAELIIAIDEELAGDEQGL